MSLREEIKCVRRVNYYINEKNPPDKKAYEFFKRPAYSGYLDKEKHNVRVKRQDGVSS